MKKLPLWLKLKNEEADLGCRKTRTKAQKNRLQRVSDLAWKIHKQAAKESIELNRLQKALKGLR